MGPGKVGCPLQKLLVKLEVVHIESIQQNAAAVILADADVSEEDDEEVGHAGIPVSGSIH